MQMSLRAASLAAKATTAWFRSARRGSGRPRSSPSRVSRLALGRPAAPLCQTPGLKRQALAAASAFTAVARYA
jgi:hypothetical protein